MKIISSMETRRFVWFMALVFSVALLIQHFELPYGYFVSSLLSFGKSRVTSHGSFLNRGSSNRTGKSDVKSETTDTPFNGSSGVSNHLDDDDNSSRGFVVINDNSTVERVVGNKSVAPEMASNWEKKSSLENISDTNVVPVSIRNEDRISPIISPQVAVGPSNLYPHVSSPESSSPISSTGKDVENILQNRDSFASPEPELLPISKMNDMLLQSRVSYRAMKPRWTSTVDQELLNANSLIKNASVIKEDSEFDVNLFRNFSEFKRSYELMEQTLKVYIYTEGERPVFHLPYLKGIYGSEGWFMKQLKSNEKFVTKNPEKAHLFYLPFSSRMLQVALYVPDSNNINNLIERLSNYTKMITKKYNFWNRTDGADHFLVACHDWAPAETRQIMPNCIRALCNSDIKEGFRFGKDVSLPETLVRYTQNPLRQLGGNPPSERRILAFFAGRMHGYLRPILLKHWENKDPDMKIFGRMRRGEGEMSYVQYMKSSKYCICARGFEVNSPRLVEAIFYDCVPVIISDDLIPPFFETLNWESFAVFMWEKDVPNLKSILLSISEEKYVKMQKRVRQVQKHFLWHNTPEKYDVFHMILHSMWYNRVFQTGSW